VKWFANLLSLRNTRRHLPLQRRSRRSNDLKEFSERLLNDLLHIAAAEWFVVRTIDEHGHLSLFAASTDTASVRDLVFGAGKLGSAEAESARTRTGVEFGPNRHSLRKILWQSFSLARPDWFTRFGWIKH